MRLSVMCLPQSRGFDDGFLYIGVLYGVMVSEECVRIDLCVRRGMWTVGS